MAEIILDLSGQAGLADNFFGDTDMITPQPNLINNSQPGQMAQGLFNPYLRKGYLAPITTTSVALSLDTPAAAQFGSVEHDYTNGITYFGDTTSSIYSSSSLTDTSLELIKELDYTTAFYRAFYELHDLQVYQVNGEYKLFYTGIGTVENSPTNAQRKQVSLATIPSANDSAWGSVSINPESTTQPTVLDDVRNFESGSSTTQTTSVTVPAGTNKLMTVIVFNSSGQTVTSITYGGTPMTVQSNSSGSGASVAIYTLVDPAVGTANVVATFVGAVSNRLTYVIITDGTDQTNPVYGTVDVDTTATTLNIGKRIVKRNQLTLYAAYSDEVLAWAAPYTQSLYDTTNNYGSDALYYGTKEGLYLQVGIADLPALDISVSEASWIGQTVTGASFDEVYGDSTFMRVADNGFAYVFADNWVHKIDGTITGGVNGTLTRNVLLFPEFFRITDAQDYRSRMYIAIHQYPVSVRDTTVNTFNGMCGIYVWNRISTQLSGADYIELPGVREIKRIIKSPDGQLKLLVVADNGLTQLRQFGYNDSGGVVFPTVKELGVGAHPQFPDGVTTAGDKVMWLGNDGKIYCDKQSTITQLYQAKAPGTTTATVTGNIESGILFYGSGDETASAGYRSNKQALTFSYLDGATHTVAKIYPFDLKTGANGNQTPSQGDVHTGVQYIPITSVLRKVRVYNAPITGTGTDVIATVKLYFNQSSTAGMTKSISKDEAKRGYVDFAINKPYIHAIQIEVEWATGEPIGEDMYLPSVAIISHDPTETSSPDSE